MDNDNCHCNICCNRHKKTDMHLRRTPFYPYKEMILMCPRCKESQDKRDALKNAKREVKKTPRSAYCFKW